MQDFEAMDPNSTDPYLGSGLSDEARTALLNNDLTNAEALAALGDWTEYPLSATNSNAVTEDWMVPLMHMWDMGMENKAFSIDKYEAETVDQIEASRHDVEMLQERVKVEQMMLQKEQKRQDQTLIDSFVLWDDVSLA
ncbi:MAG: hypothetical protein Q9184_000282 [Pyrenodesmia sp. 2 TL-2023]